MANPFLTAQWRHLVMLNWEVDPELLRERVPHGTELDDFAGRTYLSLVGFLFLDTRVLGMPIPWHQDFEEVNLRFYVRRQHFGVERRGVVFLKEIVPLWAVATVANWFYGENYVSLPMKHEIDVVESPPTGGLETPGNPMQRRLAYEWQYANEWYKIEAATTGGGQPAAEGSLEEYLTEHYWGYACAGPTACTEYEVTHPRWNIWPCAHALFTGDAAALYGPQFGAILSRPADCAFVCDGSAISVHHGVRLG